MVELSGKFIFTAAVVAVALLIGLLATALNILHAKGPKERAFVARACLGTWTLFISMLLLVYLFEAPYRYIIFLMYLIIFPLTIYRWATMHQLIRHIDEMDTEHEGGETPQTS